MVELLSSSSISQKNERCVAEGVSTNKPKPSHCKKAYGARVSFRTSYEQPAKAKYHGQFRLHRVRVDRRLRINQETISSSRKGPKPCTKPPFFQSKLPNDVVCIRIVQVTLVPKLKPIFKT